MQHPNGAPITVARLWRGCILGSIADALECTRIASQESWRYWEGSCYRRIANEPDYGSIAFVGNEAVGLLFGHESERNPYRSPSYRDEIEVILGQIPGRFKGVLVNQLLGWMNKGGLPPEHHLPVTAAFWSDAGVLTPAEAWDSVMFHSGDILATELLDRDQAIQQLIGAYGLQPKQAHLMQELYERKVAYPDELIVLTETERDQLIVERPATRDEWEAVGLGEAGWLDGMTGGDDDVGIAIGRRLLGAIGIFVP